MKQRDCTIIIDTYFGNEMLLNLIKSILANVKNPIFMVYKNDEGWLTANNRMLNSVNTDVLLLNDDTIVVSDIVEHMKNVAYHSFLNAGIVGGKALAPNNETVINYGITVFTDGNTSHRFYGKHKSEINFIQEQQAIEGSCMYIRRDVIDKIGVFDTRYGAGYRAEVDFAFRAREAGYKIHSSPDAEYIHFQSATHGKLGIKNDTFDIFKEQWGRKLKLGEI